jgi:hypothetical protein
MSQKMLFQLGGVGLGVPPGRNPALVNQGSRQFVPNFPGSDLNPALTTLTNPDK